MIADVDVFSFIQGSGDGGDGDDPNKKRPDHKHDDDVDDDDGGDDDDDDDDGEVDEEKDHDRSEKNSSEDRNDTSLNAETEPQDVNVCVHGAADSVSHYASACGGEVHGSVNELRMLQDEDCAGEETPVAQSGIHSQKPTSLHIKIEGSESVCSDHPSEEMDKVTTLQRLPSTTSVDTCLVRSTSVMSIDSGLDTWTSTTPSPVVAAELFYGQPCNKSNYTEIPEPMPGARVDFEGDFVKDSKYPSTEVPKQIPGAMATYPSTEIPKQIPGAMATYPSTEVTKQILGAMATYPGTEVPKQIPGAMATYPSTEVTKQILGAMATYPSTEVPKQIPGAMADIEVNFAQATEFARNSRKGEFTDKLSPFDGDKLGTLTAGVVDSSPQSLRITEMSLTPSLKQEEMRENGTLPSGDMGSGLKGETEQPAVRDVIRGATDPIPGPSVTGGSITYASEAGSKPSRKMSVSQSPDTEQGSIVLHGPEEDDDDIKRYTENNAREAIPGQGQSLRCDGDSGESMSGQNGGELVIPDSSLNLGRGIQTIAKTTAVVFTGSHRRDHGGHDNGRDHGGRDHGGRDHGGRDHGGRGHGGHDYGGRDYGGCDHGDGLSSSQPRVFYIGGGFGKAQPVLCGGARPKEKKKSSSSDKPRTNVIPAQHYAEHGGLSQAAASALPRPTATNESTAHPHVVYRDARGLQVPRPTATNESTAHPHVVYRDARGLQEFARNVSLQKIKRGDYHGVIMTSVSIFVPQRGTYDSCVCVPNTGGALCA